jgi:hypothetical protein
MKTLPSVAAAAATVAMLALGGIALAAPNPNAASAGNKLQCFDGTTDGGFNGTCALVQNGAVLNTNDGDSDPNNNYAGVYILNSNLGGKLLSEVNKLSFSYSGSGATGGSPRVSIPIDTNGDGGWDAFAFADTLGCNNGDPNNGILDVVNDSTCTIAFGSDTYANWAAFVSANPTYRIAQDALTFIIVDQPGQFTISNVQLGKGPAKAR